MDPQTVIRAIWRYKVFVLPAMLITLIAVVYVFQFGPRYFESSMSYAMVNPKLPTDKELDTDPELGNLNKDNPFLRSSDPSLITEVLIARLSSKDVAAEMEFKGLSTDYSVSKGINGNGFVVSITGNGESEEQALATTKALGAMLEEELTRVQKINGADDRFLFTPLVINSPYEATEQFSSRLRSVIMVFLGGAVVTFGAVSLARSLESRRARLKASQGAPAEGGGPSVTQGRRGSSLVVPSFQPAAPEDISRPQHAGTESRRTNRAGRPAPREELSREGEPARH